ncbi:MULTISPECIES: 2-dehydropantoate 2-reductase [Staphylococcaceae]|jgi:2-dehydropantoate 2-reductase|uniref:2-dehydropantoate 2-reductase n=1 Tax=Aliicoccus persicus TaxID=930138 RepID=A0A662Z3R8_9STAP|nr:MULTISPECIES: 2-dehydropantoate 2-reductase [Staphylococcaceae]RTX91635.1 2-dehydropantoate 2-reductase [Mammaliicoccus fleurettii]SEV86053.1 2-dehydropantoate 2-reductase [Aliicoccus persicus]SUN01381.1 2-dehydropantoate 2-reductase [Mammaliicoccus fleurettii]
MKIAVAGAGALGGRVGIQLHESGVDVTLIDKWEEHVNAINEKGMEVHTEDKVYQVPVKAKLLEDIDESYDLIIILTKAMYAEDMLQALYEKNSIHAETAILTMMNGLGHGDRLAKYVSKDRIYLAVTMWTAGLKGPGQIVLTGSGGIQIQRADGIASKMTEEINDIFNTANLNSIISRDVQHSIWAKATLNSVLNPLCSILDKRIGEFAAYGAVIEMITPIIEEIIEVAGARGVNLDFDASLEKIKAAFPDSAAGLHYPSMHQDLAKGVQTEVDYLNGKISEYGKEYGIKTPNNDMITHLIHQLEMKNH